MNQRNQGCGRGTGQSYQVDYHKGTNVVQEKYNQILHMLGQSKPQGNTEGSSTSATTPHSSANLAQDNYPSAGNVIALLVSTTHT